MITGLKLTTFVYVIICGVYISVTSAEVVTSSLKVHRMVMEEGRLLGELKNYIDAQYERLRSFSDFYVDRIRNLRERVTSPSTTEELSHPNGVYAAIKRFALDYEYVLGDNYESFRKSFDMSSGQFLADSNDVKGARQALLRLQSVYNLRPEDMAKGNYLGYTGPPLKPIDFYEIAQTAFTESQLEQSHAWLNLSLKMHDENIPAWERPPLGAIKALMGRVILYKGDILRARQFYAESKELDRTNGDVIALKEELESQPRITGPEEKNYFSNFSRLCSLENGLHAPPTNDSRLVCRYRAGLQPYYRFKEEILSVSPFASVIYDVITDEENKFVKDQVKNTLVRGKIAENFVSDEIRTSDLAWLYDKDSPRVHTISRRVSVITGLDVTQRKGGPDSAEAFQVVNYGLGGHYEVHMDPFEDKPKNPELQGAGDRIATFLIYLSDVERGGATVFTRAGIAVAPKKNMALLWYNYTPDMNRDEMTHHAGCPVVIGQKWVTNKWIWTYGNTFRRRCGLKPHDTQLDLERG